MARMKERSLLDCIPSVEVVRIELVRKRQEAEALEFLLGVSQEVEKRRANESGNAKPGRRIVGGQSTTNPNAAAGGKLPFTVIIARSYGSKSEHPNTLHTNEPLWAVQLIPVKDLLWFHPTRVGLIESTRSVCATRSNGTAPWGKFTFHERTFPSTINSICPEHSGND